MPSAQVCSQDTALQGVVVAELERGGFRIVPQSEADCTLACQVENNWRTCLRPPMPLFQSSVTLVFANRGCAVQPVKPLLVSYSAGAFPCKKQIPALGVRLDFYSSPSLRAGRFETAGESTIEAGSGLRPEREPIQVKILLTYSGREYVGRLKLTE